ncbi:gephyrin-like molybdotransferase Glp [Sandaracinus amylolyticus]|uniref:Molybdopterin molybdenumtransferase n=1 Tax=Sandaracinus amylolyticus TaxID=927083 RepID=A0A0F6YHY1_9BACT|nr:gephyrin-like molybdotransferase Glp [Sandaracinus amylolyticus]AKF06345.1 Molybdopterin biosynthesis protein MoeA [Sandaracinus amylolyticus]
MLSIADALESILASIPTLGAERVSLDDALGRVLAAPVFARHDAPPFDASAMDGWAVRTADLASASDAAPIALEPRGESRAGGEWPEAITARTTMRIFTGAPVPEGADAVVMQEDVDAYDGAVRFRRVPAPGAHVRARGEDLAVGAEILALGARIGAGETALLASQGVTSVDVLRAPRVAVLVNGDELRDPGEPARPGSIFDSNGPTIAAAVREAGGVAIRIPRAPDELEALTARVREGLRADALVVCGGVSVGDHDLVHLALAAAGVEARFWKVAMKPGKPLTFGLAATTPVFGLPGNPVSAWVTFELFVRPALRRMMGDPRPFRRVIDVELGHAHRRSTGRVELARARLEWRDGRAIASIGAKQGSGSTQSIANVDALLILPADVGTIEQGARLRAMLLRDASDASPFA